MIGWRKKDRDEAQEALGGLLAGYVGQREQAKEAGAVAVADGLDVLVLAAVIDRADRDAARQIGLGPARDDADEGLRVGAHAVPNVIRELGQTGGIGLHTQEQVDRAEHTTGEHHLLAREDDAPPSEQASALQRLDAIAAARQRPYRRDLGVRPDR